MFPVQGNHDTWPVNAQDFSKPNSDIPINAFMADWAEWLDADALTVFGEYGYYSNPLTLKTGETIPNAKIIAINS